MKRCIIAKWYLQIGGETLKPNIFLLLISCLAFERCVISTEYQVSTPTFNSGGGVQGGGRLGNNHSLGEAVVPTFRTSPRYNLSSGFINVLHIAHADPNQGRLVYSQSVQVLEDNPLNIELAGDVSVTSFTVKDMPKHGKVTGDSPNLIYIPETNYYGADFFTFYGFANGERTEDAIVNINVINVNDPPSLTVVDGFIGSSEDEDTNISYDSIFKYVNMSDAEGSDLTLIISKVHTGLIISEKPPHEDGRYRIEEEQTLEWRPEKDQFGLIEAFSLVAFDGQMYSDESTFRISVAGIEDMPVLSNPIQDLERDENAEDIVLDLSELFYDADGGKISYFVKDWSNKLLLTPVIDETVLTIALKENANGKSIIQIGGESNGQYLYDEFEVNIVSKFDADPFIVNTYWKGSFEGVNEIEIAPPIRVWSFSSMENILKSELGNWKYAGEDEEPVLSGSPLLTINENDWRNVYYTDGASVRVQNETSIDLVVPENKSGADWAKRNNTYTFVFDIRVQYGVNHPLLNTSHGEEVAKSELWINPFGAIGGQGSYSSLSAVQSGKWYRVAYVVDGESQLINYYVDENLKKSRFRDNMIDGRHSIGTSVKVGYDRQVSNKSYELRRVVYYDYPLNRDQINFLGRMSYEEFNEENSRSLEYDETLIYLYQGEMEEGEGPTVFMSTIESNVYWYIQTSANLFDWVDYRLIETTKVEDAENNLRVGQASIDDAFNRNQLFYRVRAVE